MPFGRKYIYVKLGSQHTLPTVWETCCKKLQGGICGPPRTPFEARARGFIDISEHPEGITKLSK